MQSPIRRNGAAGLILGMGSVHFICTFAMFVIVAFMIMAQDWVTRAYLFIPLPLLHIAAMGLYGMEVHNTSNAAWKKKLAEEKKPLESETPGRRYFG